MLLDFLGLLGLSANEIKIYLCLVEQERASASGLARGVEVPRTTVHSVLEGLVEKGLVRVDKSGSRAMYSANRPDSIQNLVSREREVVEEKQKVATQVVNLLTPYFASGSVHIPKMEFYEGQSKVEGMLYNNLPEWEESLAADDTTIWGYQDHSFVEQYRPWLEHHWERRQELYPEQTINLFSNQSDVEAPLVDAVEKRFIRVIPEMPEFSSSIWLMGEYLLLLQTRVRPHYAVQLKDQAFSSNIKAFVKFLWSQTS